MELGDEMPWFKVDDGLFTNPKVLAVSDAAMGLWVKAGSYCARHLTDGFVSKSSLKVLAKRSNSSLVRELLLSGLWEECDGGWRFVSWSEYQPTKADVERERLRKQEAGRIGGLKSGETRRSKSEAGASESGPKNEAGASRLLPEIPNPRPVPDPFLRESARDGVRHATGLSLNDELVSACQMAGTPRPTDQDLVDYEVHLAATQRLPASYAAGFVQWMRRKPQFERGRPQTADHDDEEARARRRAKDAAEAMRRRQAGQSQ